MHASKFKIEVPDWTKIDISNAKMILDEGKDYLKYLSAGSDKVTNRAFAVLAILIPITSALIAYIISPRTNRPGNSLLYHGLLSVPAFVLIILMFGLGYVVFPRLYMPAGTMPEEICTQDFLGLSLDPELARLALVLGMIENCQAKIVYNEKQLCRRTVWLKWLMLSLGTLFITTIIFLLIQSFS